MACHSPTRKKKSSLCAHGERLLRPGPRARAPVRRRRRAGVGSLRPRIPADPVPRGRRARRKRRGARSPADSRTGISTASLSFATSRGAAASPPGCAPSSRNASSIACALRSASSRSRTRSTRRHGRKSGERSLRSRSGAACGLAPPGAGSRRRPVQRQRLEGTPIRRSPLRGQ